MESFTLQGQYLRLDPLQDHHAAALADGSAGNRELYKWSPVPDGNDHAIAYIKTACAWRSAGTAFPFAIVRIADEKVVGSTRFWNIERWAWPEGHPRHGREAPDACEIGYTWFSADAIRTAANSEAKLLMLTHAFEVWQVFRVCFHTDSRNQRSRIALERIGAQFEGVLRAHRMAADFIPRDSLRFSILAAEWPAVKQRLVGFLEPSNHRASRI